MRAARQPSRQREFLSAAWLSLRLLMVIALTLLVGTCAPRLPMYQQIDTAGVLKVATVNSASTYYLDAGGPTGPEYDLASAFARELDVKLDWRILPDWQAVAEAVADRRVHMAVGLPISDPRKRQLRFTPAYAAQDMKVVYRVGTPKPDNLAALSGQLTLPAHTALADWLRAQHPDIEFTVDTDANTEELMDRVANHEIHATIANTDIVAMNQRYYPNLRVAFTLTGARQRTAWGFAPLRPGSGNDGLYTKAIAYLDRMRDNGRLAILHDRYFGHVQRLGFVGGHEFARQVTKRLPRWKSHFKRAAKRVGLDWRLLAATGYQESHWDKNAVSPTTVRGIMMLTEATASEVGVHNRRDPQQSIAGGARYLHYLIGRLPPAITEPDRTWFALAAYNVGYGHVMDARRLLTARNRNPNLWVNLRDALVWLTQDRYLPETRYGYARGLEAKAYVGNIRAYYDILVWLTSDRRTRQPAALNTARSAAGARIDQPPAIAIDSPAF